MSKNKRNVYGAEFKDKIALEAIKVEQTVAELASRYGLTTHHDHQPLRATGATSDRCL